jgi:hypothetical protein
VNILDLVGLERKRRVENPAGWTRVIVWTDEEEAAAHAAGAEGRINGNLIIRRIVDAPIIELEPPL